MDTSVTNCILITNGSRPRLLEQMLRTLRENTVWDQYNLTIVSDGEIDMRSRVAYDPSITTVTIDPPCHIIGRLKNLGAYWSEKQFGRGEWLLFCDDDMALLDGWLEKVEMVYRGALEVGQRLCLLGGVRHPFHGVGLEHKHNDRHLGWQSVDAVAGYCHFMRWSTWDHFGPYDAHAKGTGQSEDYALSRKIVDAGGKVGYIHPPVMAHCGLTNSEGKPILGGELIERMPGILYE